MTTTTSKAAELEATVRRMTLPIDGRYPRPQMTTSTDPASCRVFSVGMNQRNPYPVEAVGTHEHYLDALFNRHQESCHKLYNDVVGPGSPTRKNTTDFVERLARQGVSDVIETNVVCHSTPMSADLRRGANRAGAASGRALFRALLAVIEPRVLIVHGRRAAKLLGSELGHRLPAPPTECDAPVQVRVGQFTVFVIPSLAPPAYNTWCRWADGHLDRVAEVVARHLA